MKRTDSMPLRYERDEQQQGSAYKPKVDQTGNERAWNLKKLHTREDPLVIFTLISQAVIGAFITLFVGPLLGFDTLSMSAHPVALPLLLFGLIGVQTLALTGSLNLEGGNGLFMWVATAMMIVATALIGRTLFYALVIPTTMPGAFFWRNKGFEEHARETGLAEMPQVGVLP